MKKIVYLAIFFISYSVFIFEIILLKFLAFKIISSWAFLVISIAFLGIGALLFAPLSQFLGFNLLLLISCFLYPFAGLFLINYLEKS